jgi:hypothetical protein
MKPKHPARPPMTFGNMRKLDVHREQGDIIMIRAALVGLLLCTVGTIEPVTAGDSPSLYLKDVKMVMYQLTAQPPNKGRCAIDIKSWNTAIDFVANQSTKLKLIPSTIWPSVSEISDPKFDMRKFLAAPLLTFSIMTLDTNTGCAGTLSAEVGVLLEPTKIIATDKSVDLPAMTIWSEEKTLSGPYGQFPSYVVQKSEQMMKSFVNDWATAQGE